MALLTSHAPVSTLADILNAAKVLKSRDARPESHASMSSQPSNLTEDLIALFTLLNDRQVSYLLVGGIALLRYVDGRNTEDVDLVLSTESLKALPEIAVSHQTREGVFRSLRVDVLLTENPLFEQVISKHATTHAFHEVQVRWATVEGLILLKLFALPSLYRQGNVQRVALYEADVTMLIDRHRPDLQSILEVLQSHLDAGAMKELRMIVSDIEKRIGRVSDAKRN
jgi:hypothetical protein